MRPLLCSTLRQPAWLAFDKAPASSPTANKVSEGKTRMVMYSIENLGRRDILMMSAVLAGSGAVVPSRRAAAEAALQRTPDQILGPFYPLKELSQTTDLTRLPGPPGRAG